jgi:hypothetical protein
MKFILAFLALSVTSMQTHAETPPAAGSHHVSTTVDRAAIAAVLDRYTQCVTTGDEAGFRALLLDDDIPFSAVSPASTARDVTSTSVRRYVDFRDAVFRSGQHFRQSFSNVRIEQDGPLAQASLDFVTRRGDDGSVGWKVLQLVKTADGWKIASEFFTVRKLR